MKKLIPFFLLLLAYTVHSQSLIEKSLKYSVYDVGYYILHTSDNGFAIVGETLDTNGFEDIVIIKLDSLGNQVWHKIISDTLEDGGRGLLETENGYIIGGYTNSKGYGNTDAYMIKIDSIGDTIWTKTYGTASEDILRSIEGTKDGGYILGCSSTGNGKYWDFNLIKLDSSGNQLWSKYYGDAGGQVCNSVIETMDSGFVMVGRTNEDYFIVKTNSIGDSLWSQTIGGDSMDYAYTVLERYDSTLLVAGYTQSFGNGNQILLATLDQNGDTLKTRVIGGSGDENISSIVMVDDSTYYLAGHTSSIGNGGNDIYILELNYELDTIKTMTFGGALGEISGKMIQLKNGQFALTGSISGPDSTNIYFLVFNSNEGITLVERKNIHKFELKIHPSFVDGEFKLVFPKSDTYRVKIIDMKGSEYSSFMALGLSTNITINSLPSGNYIINAEDSKGNTYSAKMFKR